MTHYYIPKHVHFAVEGEAAVFLDLRSDRYSMLLGPKARSFASLLSRTSDSIQRTIMFDAISDAPASQLAAVIVAELLDNRLLTTDKDHTASPLPAQIASPQETLLEPPASSADKLRVYDTLAFLAANAVARWKLRYESIEQTVGTIERRNKLGRRDNPVDLQQARRLVGLYARLRPLCTQASMCLLDSLTLLEFLARYKCYPSWVFAVQFEPWAAHCWVQYGNIAFNQDTEAARTYLPLMIV